MVQMLPFHLEFALIGDVFEDSGFHVFLGLADVVLPIYRTSCPVD